MDFYSPAYLEIQLDKILKKRKSAINLIIKEKLIEDAPELLKNLNIKFNTVLYGDGVISRYKIKYRFLNYLFQIRINEDLQTEFLYIDNKSVIMKKSFFDKEIKIFKEDKHNDEIIRYLKSKSWYKIITTLEKIQK